MSIGRIPGIALILALVAAGCSSSSTVSSGADGGGSGGASESGGTAAGGSESGGTAAGGSESGGTGDGGSESGGTAAGGIAGGGGSAGEAGGAAGEATEGGGGSGGEPPTDLPVGATCTANPECAGGNCVDDVCCESACAGPCERCDGDGKCVATAADSQCTAVPCADTACLTGTPIAAGECKAQGECFSSSDCEYTEKPVGTSCGDFAECDSRGDCQVGSPGTVVCGAQSAGPVSCMTGQKCCGSSFGSLSCTSGTCADQGDDLDFESVCDEHADCGAGAFCLVRLGKGDVFIGCSGTSETFPTESGVVSGRLCETFLGSADCPVGESCEPSPLLPSGYKMCVKSTAVCDVADSVLTEAQQCDVDLPPGVVPVGCNLRRTAYSGTGLSASSQTCGSAGWGTSAGTGNPSSTPRSDVWTVSCDGGSAQRVFERACP